MELIGYEDLRARQRELRSQGRYLGIGFSPFVEQGAWAGAVAAAQGFPGFNYLDAVSVAMEPDGTVTLTTGLQSNGQGHETTMAQVAADELGVRLEDVKVVQGDTARTAYATGSYGSRTAVIGSGAIRRAAGDVRDKLLAIAAHLFEAATDDLELADGRISVLGSPDKSFTIREVATAAYWGPWPADMDPALIATRSYDPPETYSNACIAVVVEVDAETGQVKIERIVAVEDCGTVLNPAVVEGQVIGAIAQGIGAVLYEQLPYDEDGNFLAGTLVDFLYPTAPEVPAIEVDHLETPSPVTEGGMKGMGEGGLIGGPSAIVNAISDALGVPVDRTPLRPCDVLELVAAARSV
jgi:carbon-monoxide dehydrogenase large subunit